MIFLVEASTTAGKYEIKQDKLISSVSYVCAINKLLISKYNPKKITIGKVSNDLFKLNAISIILY